MGFPFDCLDGNRSSFPCLPCHQPMLEDDQRMQKGKRHDGMHADMLVIFILTALQSLIGIPWLVSATV
jgi:hypothetical protein